MVDFMAPSSQEEEDLSFYNFSEIWYRASLHKIVSCHTCLLVTTGQNTHGQWIGYYISSEVMSYAPGLCLRREVTLCWQRGRMWSCPLLIERAARSRHATGGSGAWGTGTRFQLTHNKQQASNLVDASQILGELIPVILSGRLVLRFRNIARHEPALKG